jgi:hypothetical protein
MRFRFLGGEYVYCAVHNDPYIGWLQNSVKLFLRRSN